MSLSTYTVQLRLGGVWKNVGGYVTESRDEALDECIAMLGSYQEATAARALLGENGSGNGAVAHHIGQLPANSEDALRRIEARLRNEFLTAAGLALEDVMRLLDEVCRRAPVVHAARFGDSNTLCGIRIKAETRKTSKPREVSCRRCFRCLQ